MELKIAKRQVELKFGTRFLRELDKNYKLEVEQGVEIDFGLNRLFINFQSRSITALAFAIYSASRTNAGFKPTVNHIDDFLDEQEDIEWLFEAIEEELSESVRTKKDWSALMGLETE